MPPYRVESSAARDFSERAAPWCASYSSSKASRKSNFCIASASRSFRAIRDSARFVEAALSSRVVESRSCSDLEHPHECRTLGEHARRENRAPQCGGSELRSAAAPLQDQRVACKGRTMSKRVTLPAMMPWRTEAPCELAHEVPPRFLRERVSLDILQRRGLEMRCSDAAQRTDFSSCSCSFAAEGGVPFSSRGSSSSSSRAPYPIASATRMAETAGASSSPTIASKREPRASCTTRALSLSNLKRAARLSKRNGRATAHLGWESVRK